MRPPVLRLSLLVGLLLCAFAGSARATVEFKGLSRTTERVVRATITLDDEPCNVADARLRRVYRRTDELIRDALEVYGYYQPVIEKTLARNESCWVATYTIQRGPRVRLRKVLVGVSGAGANDPVLAGFVGRQPFAADDGLNQREYEQFKADLASLAQRRGYFDARFAARRIDVYPEERSADLLIDFASGERYRFGPVTLEQDVLRERLARRYIEFKPGDYYDADRINELYTALLSGGYFQNIELRTTPRPAPDLDVPVSIVLSPSDPRTWTTGVGFATDSGAKFRLGFLHQRLNRSGHQLEFASAVSDVLGDATLSYRLPLGRPRDEWLSFDTGYQYENPGDSRSEEFRIGVKQIQRRWGDWRETRFIDYSHENFRVGEERGTSNLVIPGVSWATQPLLPGARPRRAQRFALKLGGTDEILGSDTAFMQLEGAAKVILPLWSTARVLARLEAGWTIKEEFKDLPFSVRYFAGGDDSVRGYDYKALGPVDAEGNVIGGANKLVGSLEFDQRILDNWSVAAFVDLGNAFDSFKDMTLRTSVGGGIRWYSPLGPVRIDIGVPVDNDAPDSFRLHVTLGPDL
jgi:translocation and assembly module TamA